MDLTKPAQVVKNIVIGKVELPKSLQEQAEASSAVSASSRAVGEVTTLSSLTLPSLKAQGYYTFKDSISRGSIVSMFINALKTSAAIKDDTLALNTTASVGTITMSMPGLGTLQLTNAGKIKTTLSADGNTLSIYWNMSYPDTTKMYKTDGTKAYPNDQDFFDNAPRIPILLYFLVKKTGAMEMYASSTAMGMKFWTQYDPSTKESVTAQTMGQQSKSISLVKPQTDGSFFILDKYESQGSDSSTSINMGYANDSYGGVASSYSSSYNGQSTAGLNVEFYNGSGDLIYQGYGNSASQSSQWSWMGSNLTNTYNLYNATASHAKPTGFQVRRTYKYYTDSRPSTNSQEISIDGGATWSTVPETCWQFTYHVPQTSDTSSSWTVVSGDASYSVSQSTYATDSSVPGVYQWTSTSTYYKYYEVPAAETYFGSNYYVSKQYPLKNLLPLSGQYATGFDVKQKEGSTWYSWKKTSGSWEYGTVAPTEGTYDANSLNSWTSYTYWLENTAFRDKDGVDTNLDTQCDTDKGDVNFNNLTEMTVWYWNAQKGQSVSAKSPAYTSYIADLPPFFSLASTGQTAVNAVKTKLESFYAEGAAKTPESYLATFDTTFGAVTGEFPQ